VLTGIILVSHILPNAEDLALEKEDEEEQPPT
jgi:hypothetical protein